MDDKGKHLVMIIDDEEDVRSMLENFFESLGYRTVSAADLNQAVFILNRQMPDVIFLDIVLPGANGIEILKLLKKLNPDLIVVMMSGFATEPKAKSALELGAFDYLSKPFDLSHIKVMMDRIDTLLV